jgi:hypothetical protein
MNTMINTHYCDHMIQLLRLAEQQLDIKDVHIVLLRYLYSFTMNFTA